MSIEFFRPESQRPLDADGYEIDSATREIAEIDAWFADQVEPSEADQAWLAAHPIAGGAPFEPTDGDWDQMAAWSEHLDRLDSLRRESDAEDEARRRFG
jgi:hypothetical protein